MEHVGLTERTHHIVAEEEIAGCGGVAADLEELD